MTKQQSRQNLEQPALDGLSAGDPQALVEQKLVSAQNSVVVERAAYNKALTYRAQCIALAHAAGWSKYRIAQRLGITRRAIDEALERPTMSPTEFLREEITRNGGREDTATQRLNGLLHGG
jgi:hypothetical protein